MNKPDHLIVKTLMGLEPVLAQELEQIGATGIEILNRAVKVDYDKKLLYKANLALRTALRILVPITTFTAQTDDQLYKGAMQVNWTEFFELNKTFSVKADIKTTYFKHSNFVSIRVKDAIVDRFRDEIKLRPNVDPKEPQIQFYVLMGQDKVTIYMDSSGESLHKRGYKVRHTKAPVSEVLAAGMILLTGWDGSQTLVDGMCGSGTILCEAGMIALNKAPNLKRRNFCFKNWKDFEPKLLKEVTDELKTAEKEESDGWIYGYDISGNAIISASENITGLELDDSVKLKKIDFISTHAPKDHAIVILNPPYGARLQVDEIENLYREIGNTLKHKYKTCSAWIISSNAEAMKHVGLKTNKKLHLMNGELECAYNRYDILED
ncbi:MAG: RNA methyltransferase [Chitinophagales bacterium]|nr:RNA methyltransferase [Chitinophagales bacterium]